MWGKKSLEHKTEKWKKYNETKSWFFEKTGMPWWLKHKESTCNGGDPGSILGSGRSLGEENGNPLQYSCLGNPTDGAAWQATVHGVRESYTLKRLNTHTLLI